MRSWDSVRTKPGRRGGGHKQVSMCSISPPLRRLFCGLTLRYRKTSASVIGSGDRGVSSEWQLKRDIRWKRVLKSIVMVILRS